MDQVVEVKVRAVVGVVTGRLFRRSEWLGVRSGDYRDIR